MNENRASIVTHAREQAAQKNGDVLPLQLLENVRIMAQQQGWVRRRKESHRITENIHKQESHLGDDVFVPVPGQDVGSGARASWRDPHPLGMLLDAAIRERGMATLLDVASMSNRWEEVAGKHIAQHSKVEKFTDTGVLTIRTRTVGWETQLRALTAAIDQRLAEVLGEGVVKEIVIKGPYQRSWKHGAYSVPGRGPRDTYD